MGSRLMMVMKEQDNRSLGDILDEINHQAKEILNLYQTFLDDYKSKYPNSTNQEEE